MTNQKFINKCPKQLKSRFFYLLLFCYLFIFAASSYALDANKIDATLDSDEGKIIGENSITYTNQSTKTLDKLYFRLDLNYGFFTKIAEIITGNGSSVPGEFYKYEFLDKKMTDNTLYQVALPDKLASGENTNLTLKFNASGLYKEGEILYLIDSFEETGTGCWYPRIMPFKKDEWQPKEYETSTYNVRLNINTDETLITSAKLLEVNKTDSVTRQYIFEPVSTRGFDIVCGKNLMFEQITVGDLILKVYYRPQNTKWGKKISEIAKDIILFYKKKLGFYTQTHLSIVPGNQKNRGGIVSNNLIVVHDTLNNFNSQQEAENFLRGFLSYAIAKQYFGVYIGDSNNYPKWLSTGLSLYFSRLYTDSKGLNRDRLSRLGNAYIDAVNSNFDTTVLQPIDKLNHTGLDWQKIISEGKSYCIMNMLEFIVGRGDMEKIARQLCQNYTHKIVSPSEFQLICEDVTHKKLDWFFDQWLNTSKKLDYALKDVKVTRDNKKYQLSLKISQIGNAIMPVPVSVTLKNGERIFQIVESKTKETEATFQVPDDVARVSLDPGNILPDVDRTNNIFNVSDK